MAPRASQSGARMFAGAGAGGGVTGANDASTIFVTVDTFALAVACKPSALLANAGVTTSHAATKAVSVRNAWRSRDRMDSRVVWISSPAKGKQSRSESAG